MAAVTNVFLIERAIPLKISNLLHDLHKTQWLADVDIRTNALVRVC